MHLPGALLFYSSISSSTSKLSFLKPERDEKHQELFGQNDQLVKALYKAEYSGLRPELGMWSWGSVPRCMGVHWWKQSNQLRWIHDYVPDLGVYVMLRRISVVCPLLVCLPYGISPDSNWFVTLVWWHFFRDFSLAMEWELCLCFQLQCQIWFFWLYAWYIASRLVPMIS